MPAVQTGIKECPGLSRDAGTFTDCMGRVHDLLSEPLLAIKQAAPRFGAGRGSWWLRQQIRVGNVYPVMVSSSRSVEVFACAITDWKARMMKTRRVEEKGAA